MLAKRQESISHDYVVDPRGREKHMKNSCEKCRLQKEMQHMSIAVHEWPLPAQEKDAMAVVFELGCPIPFDIWRSITLHVLVDVCTAEISSTRPFMTLPGYSALRNYRECHPRQRLTLASEAKPFANCHYSNPHIPTTDDHVCVNNGLEFRPYDTISEAWTTGLLLHCDSSKLCTFILPKGPYHVLQRYLAETSYSSNDVIADQSDCHKDLTIHEFLAFGALRCGPRLQWMNILRELRARTLNFRHVEIHLLLAQAVSEVGPVSPDERLLWHEELNNAKFINALFGELESLMESSEANWLESVTFSTIVILVSRVLSSTHEETVKTRGYSLLRRIRIATFTLLTELSAKMQANKTVNQELQGRVRDMALTCRSTFDVVDVDGDASLLLTSNDDIKVFAYCAVMIYDNTPNQLCDLPQHSKLLLERDKRCCHALEAAVRQYTELHGEGLDCAIAMIWGSYRPGTSWRALLAPNSRWLVSHTASSCSQSPQAVHFDLLSGCLLVDGKQLGRLPSMIVQHPTYQSIFGDQILDIVPADIPGMEYATRGNFCDHQVSFDFRDSNDLIIRAKHSNSGSPVLQVIPSEKLIDDIPTILIQGHIHWLNLRTSEIEIRPVENAWTSSTKNWLLRFSISGFSTLQKADDTALLDIRSQTWDMISKTMRPLEHARYMMVTCKQKSCSISFLKVDLPRYGLEFFVDKDGELQSRNMRHMVVDAIQSTGTMLGLINQLVLRPKLQIADEHPRTVIIPDGPISYSPNGHHIQVSITFEGTRVKYHLYRVDTDLRCLTGNVGLTSKLYQALLHAVTSGCLPDSLTGRTGTEEALHVLHSAACRSFMKLRSRDTDLLREISSLSTMRVWYPTHLRKMQTVSWSCLAPLAQHHGFHAIAKAIMDYGIQLSAFSEGSPDLCHTLNLPLFTDHLLERASIRASAVYPGQFSLPLIRGDIDVNYASYDGPDKHAEERAFNMAFMVHQWPSRLPVQQDVLGLLTRWGNVQGVGKLSSLRYSKDWLRPKFPDIFLSVYDLCRSTTKEQAFQLVFTLASVAYGLPDYLALLPTLLAFATVPRIGDLNGIPNFSSYDLSDGFQPSNATLGRLVDSCVTNFERSQEIHLDAKPGEDERALGMRRYAAFKDNCCSQKEVILSKVWPAWPREDPPTLSTLQTSCYNINKLSDDLRIVFRSCWRNHCLKQHVEVLQGVLNQFYVSKSPSKRPSQYDLDLYLDAVASPTSYVDTQHLFDRSAPVFPTFRSSQVRSNTNRRDLVSPDAGITARLQKLTNDFRNRGSSKFHSIYANDLDRSRSILSAEKLVAPPDSTPYTKEALLQQHSQHVRQFCRSLSKIVRALSPISVAEHALFNAGLWPRVTPNFIFTRMASVSGNGLGKAWRTALVRLLRTLLQLQRSRRLLVFAANENWVEFFKELENEGCEGFPEFYPDWLLIQIESQFLARPVQVKVALEMMSPCTGRNTSLQLNMGEGKSHVIVPLAAAALSDTHKLVRVIVLKSLSAQMFQLLVERLSGLTQRRIFYVPFSRALPIDSSKVRLYRGLMQECMDTQGILVVQPDHILSFELMAVDRQLSPQAEAADEMLQAQRWLDSHTRDILDESDEILHVRYQLVYTVGLQKSLQGHPERWTTTQQVLTLVAKHADRVRRHFPSHLNVSIRKHGAFPSIRVLHPTAGEELVQWIAKDVTCGALDNFGFDHTPSKVKQAVRQFIGKEKIPNDCISLVEGHYRNTTVWPSLLVLRGLLACGILVYALKERRWRVDYGLSLKRTMLAVPFRAKDMPSLRAEFGHPDVAVTLTCLSYYYSGLTNHQLMMCFELLLKQDNPALEYESWVCGHSVPEGLRHLRGVNTKSVEQLHDLYKLFKFNKAVIDFYLSRVVFPKEAKAFPSKLTCSGWDLAQEKRHLTTGFSGTNDNRYLLPGSMVQHDLDYQRSTNARVLSFLLRPENDRYELTGQNAEGFINTLVAEIPEIRVLLDVGAQMLELKNQELAEAWLRAKHGAQAAVFVNDDDELVVVSRDGTVELLVSSPFAQQLDQCVVYLDDAHTRGTDVKLPSGFRAAVTLGPKVTKDRLTQGCMRMRKLGNGHSVMFFAPTEVDRSIRLAARKGDGDAIDVADILHWAMLETCTDIQMRVSHWIQQGSEFKTRNSAWAQFSRSPQPISILNSAWLQPEERMLEDMYAPCNSPPSIDICDPNIRKKCEDLGILSVPKRSLDEEQEREVVHEVERERQVERPSRVEPAGHSLHADVCRFVKTGKIPVQSPAFLQMLSSLVNTTAEFHERDRWAKNVLVTQDFARTVSTNQNMDDYLRPVNWVVSSAAGRFPVLVVMSPYEVNVLLPHIRISKLVQLHMYTPCTIKTMQACDDLQLYSVPSTTPQSASLKPLICKLNLFSGQLYFSNYEMYMRTCSFLGLNGPDLKGEDFVADSDGFIRQENRPAARASCPFTQSQLLSLKELFGMRRKGMGYLPTHLGKMLNGRILTGNDFLD